jgi:hypothetical protein
MKYSLTKSIFVFLAYVISIYAAAEITIDTDIKKIKNSSKIQNTEDNLSHISVGFIQFYNDDLLRVKDTFLKSIENHTKIIILQFTKFGGYLVGYDKDQIFNLSNENNISLLIGLAAVQARNYTTFWQDNINQKKIDMLVSEDIKLVNSWIINNKINKNIIGFYSSYEPLSTKFFQAKSMIDT